MKSSRMLPVQQHIVFVVNEHELWLSMKNLKVHVFIHMFKLKVASTLSCSCLYRSYNSVAAFQRSYTFVGGWPKTCCVFGTTQIRI